jgi:hypothetical protein
LFSFNIWISLYCCSCFASILVITEVRPHTDNNSSWIGSMPVFGSDGPFILVILILAAIVSLTWRCGARRRAGMKDGDHQIIATNQVAVARKCSCCNQVGIQQKYWPYLEVTLLCIF